MEEKKQLTDAVKPSDVEVDVWKDGVSVCVCVHLPVCVFVCVFVCVLL